MTEPKYLYRYQRLPDKNNPNEKDWLTQLFQENSLYFKSPKDFNDPFDCRLNIRFTGSEEEINTLKENVFKPPFWPEDKLYLLNLLNSSNEELRQAFFKPYGELFNFLHEQYKYGIFCLSEPNDDILMWSHYADKHKGYCLEFDISVMKTKWGYGNYCFPVKYNQSLPTALEIFGNTDNGESLKKMLTWKAEHWIYEKEHRIVYPHTARQNISFPPEMLTGVIFGCEMDGEHEKEIRKILKGKKIQFYKARKKPNEFGLDIVPIE